MITDTTTHGGILARVSHWIFIGLAFLVPVFFIPSGLASLPSAKGILFTAGTAILLILLLIRFLREGIVSVPWSRVSLSAMALLVVYVVAAFFAPSLSNAFVGQFEIGTVASVGAALILMLLSPYILTQRKNILSVFVALLLSFGVVALFQIVRIFGADALSLGIFSGASANLVGKWNDLGIFFGLGIILSSLTLELLPIRSLFRGIAYAVLAISILVLAFVNYTPLWYVMGVFGFIMLVYLLSIGRVGSGAKQKRERSMSVIAIVLIALSAAFILASPFLGSLGNRFLNISEVEVRPSWQGTFSVAQSSLIDNPLLGIGPNHFAYQWVLSKPDTVNQTAFWNIDFNTGIGFLPTTLTTVGALGAAGWIAFLVLFLALGYRAVFRSGGNQLGHYLLVASFFGTLFLWIFMFIYAPSNSLLYLSFILAGTFLASAAQEGLWQLKSFDFDKFPGAHFASVLTTVLLLVGAGAMLYGVAERFAVTVLLNRAVIVLNTTSDIASGERLLASGLRLGEDDRLYRVLAETEMARLSQVVNQTDVSQDILRNQFQSTLGNAIQAAQSAIAYNETNYQNWLTLGRVYEAIVPLQIDGAYESARTAYEGALARSPHNPSIPLVLARLEVAHGDNEMGRERIADSLRIKSNYTEAIFLLSQIDVSEGNTDRAIEAVEAATLIAPNDPTAFFRLGLLRYNDRDFRGAVSAFEQARTLNPNYANARYFLGLAYDAIGRSVDAIAEFEKLVETNPGNQEVAFILGNLRAGRDPFADATPPIDDSPEDREELPLEE